MCKSTGAIDWYAFSWDAFATLTTSVATIITGGIAAAAAFFIARKQNEILAQQTALLGRQARTETLAWRSDLFDRRYEVYNAVRNTAFYLRHLPPQAPVDNEIIFKLGPALDKAQFLFSKKQLAPAEALLAKATKYVTDFRNLMANGAEEGELGSVFELMSEIEDLIPRLAEAMGAEMMLFDEAEDTTTPSKD